MDSRIATATCPCCSSLPLSTHPAEEQARQGQVAVAMREVIIALLPYLNGAVGERYDESPVGEIDRADLPWMIELLYDLPCRDRP